MENQQLINVKGKELVAAGHAFAANISADTPLIDMAKMVSELATRLDVALAAAAEAGKQRDALAAAHHKLRESMAAIHNTIRLDNGHTSLSTILSAAKRAHEESLPTDTMLNAVRAEGVEMLANAIGSPYAESDRQDYEAGFNRAIEVAKTHSAPKLAARLRADAAKDGV